MFCNIDYNFDKKFNDANYIFIFLYISASYLKGVGQNFGGTHSGKGAFLLIE